ncbi:MAG: tRNA (adenosine(37)-N6)-threonylcarbamoyltransferase complex dimerization subunit type 1 TsaB [Bacteroidetes bacterium]|nr:MAG: tRNA (adenosine(37)-N6)-threonylcarbamoyltransferase complex dimerization subunit type 1 TsaB [Bacteroidota bacterium]
MGLIINIETATQVCSVALAKDGELLAIRELNEKNVHAEVLTNFIQEVIDESSLTLKDLDAIAVSMGPGSYTGLRIGLSTAKGLCYSLDKPLIAISSLQAMAQYAAFELQDKLKKNTLLTPMIDARRMEVYTAFYKTDITEASKIAPHIFSEESFIEEEKEHELILTGDGCAKSQELFSERKNIHIYPEILSSSKGMVPLSEKKWIAQDFEDIAYFEPFYLKEFIAGIPRVKGLR